MFQLTLPTNLSVLYLRFSDGILRMRIVMFPQEHCDHSFQGLFFFPSNPCASLRRLQVVTFHQATRMQGAGVREEGCLHIQASLCQGGVATGGRTHLLGFGEVRLLPLS